MLSLTDGKQGVDPRDLMPPPPAPGNNAKVTLGVMCDQWFLYSVEEKIKKKHSMFSWLVN